MTKHIFKKGEGHPRWKGGRRKVGQYYQVLRPNHPQANTRGYVYEHRIVMEQVIGRYLDPTEVVHHINGIKMDNRPENLELVNGQAEHASKHLSGHKHTRPSPLKGRKRPEISDRQTGKKHSDEWKKNISTALRHFFSDHPRHRKPS